MDEIWVRVAVVVGALLLIGAVVYLQRVRARHPVRVIETVPLAPGVYFFSSETCPTCADARAKLDDQLGKEGYTEFKWESEGDVFDELGVDAVPSVLIVSESGPSRLYPGRPERALRAL